MLNPKPSILLIDDTHRLVESLRNALLTRIDSTQVDVRIWNPREDNLEEAFSAQINEHTILVVTDYDLTTGVKGLFGPSIVAWCQSRSIPVGDFSRGNIKALPQEPNLFELRVPPDNEKGAAFIASAFQGFQAVQTAIGAADVLTESRNLAGVLANLLERPHLESQFALYMNRLGTSNSALLQKLQEFAGAKAPGDRDKLRFLTYVLGHVLLNAILKYPGPILSAKALCAYLATIPDEIDAVGHLFVDARYNGPFKDMGPLYWRENIDKILDELGEDISAEEFDSFADYNRHVAQRALKRDLARHGCERCHGIKGGFWCPFTERPVCERSSCSVPTSNWIPQGALLARIERGFYNEWAPILGY